MQKISVVIPCYNSEKTIGAVVDEIVSVVEGKLEYEIVLVNDGSTAALWEVIRSISDQYSGKVRGIRFAKNFGQHSALMAGYRAAKGDVIIQMDDDGQCDPQGIFVLLDKLEEGYDVV
ncbi:MAG: glycosyltransferase, partial [Lachnospiraceae bacterium]|nr:glycosyltransferase [Lachnospiraceae bacterium]